MFKQLIIYIIESALIMSILYLFYKYAFYKLTYFQWNRFFLLFVIFISIVMPFIRFPFFDLSSNFISDTNKDILYISGTGEVLFNIGNSENFLNNIQHNKYFNIWTVLFTIYISGVIRSFWVFIRNFGYIFKLKTRGTLIPENKGLNIIKSNQKISAFSFFKNIFVNEKFYNLNDTEQNQILEHEKIHIHQMHSFDIVFVEFVSIFFWFNPLMKRIKNGIKENHEFIVDNLLTRSNKVYDYSMLILKIKEESSLKFANSFAETQVVSRIKLMAHPEKEKIRKIRFISALPVLALTIFALLFTVNIFASINVKNKENDLNFGFPVKSDYEIVSTFFIDKVLEKENDKNFVYKLSHPEITLQVPGFTSVLSVFDGVVSDIDTIDNWGISEIKIEIENPNNFLAVYKGLAQSEVEINEKVKKNQIIGITGDIRLYPTFSLQILNNSQAVDPLLYLNY